MHYLEFGLDYGRNLRLDFFYYFCGFSTNCKPVALVQPQFAALPGIAHNQMTLGSSNGNRNCTLLRIPPVSDHQKHGGHSTSLTEQSNDRPSLRSFDLYAFRRSLELRWLSITTWTTNQPTCEGLKEVARNFIIQLHCTSALLCSIYERRHLSHTTRREFIVWLRKTTSAHVCNWSAEGTRRDYCHRSGTVTVCTVVGR